MWILLSTREAETKEIENNHICEWNQRVIFLCECCLDFLNSIFFLYEYCSGNGTAEAIHCESPSLSWEVQLIHQRAISIFSFQIYAFKKLIKNRRLIYSGCTIGFNSLCFLF